MSTAFVSLSLLIAIFSSGFITYLWLFETAYLSYSDLPIRALKNRLYPGEILPLKITLCNSTSKQQLFTTTRFISNIGSDQEVLILDPIGIVLRPGCITKISEANRIPESARPGHYQLMGTVSIPGIIRDFSVDWYTQSFEVIEKPVAAGGSPGTQSGIK